MIESKKNSPVNMFPDSFSLNTRPEVSRLTPCQNLISIPVPQPFLIFHADPSVSSKTASSVARSNLGESGCRERHRDTGMILSNANAWAAHEAYLKRKRSTKLFPRLSVKRIVDVVETVLEGLSKTRLGRSGSSSTLVGCWSSFL